MKKLILILSATLALSCGQVVLAEDTVNTEIVSDSDAFTNTNVEAESVPETDENIVVEDGIAEESEAAAEEEMNTSIAEVPENTEDIELVESPEIYNDGWVYKNGEYYYYKAGKLFTGWLKWNNVWYYLDGSNEQMPGVMLHNERKKIGGKMYYFAATGAMRKGWVKFEKEWYYTDANGAGKTGWLLDRKVWYYLDGRDNENPGRMLSNEKSKISGSYYVFGTNGAMKTGWTTYKGNWYYCNKNGAMQTGWFKDKKIWYFLNNKKDDASIGAMAKDEIRKIGGSLYAFNGSGAMQTGWFSKNGGYYYFKSSGLQATGWLKWKSDWYYLDSNNNGVMVKSGWKKIGNQSYYFNGSGAMQTGWKYHEGNWYYLNSDGSMATGWKKIKNEWYYFYCENNSEGFVCGTMATSTEIDGCLINSNGVYKATIFANNKAEDILAIAKMGLGKPYVWGGATPSGWDCSGYVTWVAKQLGVNIGRNTDDIARTCADKHVASGSSASQFHLQYDTGVIRPGDIVVFSTNYGTTVHTGIVGENKSLYHAWYPGVGTVKSDFAYVLTVDAASYQTYKIYRGAGL